MSPSRMFSLIRTGACAAGIALTALGAMAIRAQGLGLKPGLWEAHVTKQLVDGLDVSAQMAAALAQAQQVLASLPADQRERLQSMMSNAGVSQSSNGGFRICITPEMAQRSDPILDKDGHCQPVKLARHGGQVDFEFSCMTNGTTMQGHGHATITPESVSTHTEMTSTSGTAGTHQLQTDTTMSFVSADCGDVKPPQSAGG